MVSNFTSIPTGPVTLAEVRAAVGDKDPNATNAGALRKIMWDRGSYATIQKHLDTIRRERAPAAPVAPGAAPAAPKDVVDALWTAAWSAAQAVTYGRTETLSAQRDAALTLSQTQALDIAALTGDVDALTEKMIAVQSDAAAQTAKVGADLAAAVQAADDAKQALDKMTVAKAHAESDAAHAAALATRDAQIAAQTMQATMDRLNDQISDLKSLLIVRTQTHVPAPSYDKKQ